MRFLAALTGALLGLLYVSAVFLIALVMAAVIILRIVFGLPMVIWRAARG